MQRVTELTLKLSLIMLWKNFVLIYNLFHIELWEALAVVDSFLLLFFLFFFFRVFIFL